MSDKWDQQMVFLVMIVLNIQELKKETRNVLMMYVMVLNRSLLLREHAYYVSALKLQILWNDNVCTHLLIFHHQYLWQYHHSIIFHHQHLWQYHHSIIFHHQHLWEYHHTINLATTSQLSPTATVARRDLTTVILVNNVLHSLRHKAIMHIVHMTYVTQTNLNRITEHV